MSIADQLTALNNDKTAIANKITAKGGTLSQNYGFDTYANDIDTIPTGGSSQDDWETFVTIHNQQHWECAFWGVAAGLLDRAHPMTEPAEYGTANDRRLMVRSRMDYCFGNFNKNLNSTDTRFSNIDILSNYANLPKHIKFDFNNKEIRCAFKGATLIKIPEINLSGATSGYATSYSSNAFSSTTLQEIEKLKLNSEIKFNTTNQNDKDNGSPFYAATALTTIRFDAHDSNGNGLIKTDLNFQDCPLSHDTLYLARVIGDATYGNYSGLIQALFDFSGTSTTKTITLSATSYAALSAAERQEAQNKGWYITSV